MIFSLPSYWTPSTMTISAPKGYAASGASTSNFNSSCNYIELYSFSTNAGGSGWFLFTDKSATVIGGTGSPVTKNAFTTMVDWWGSIIYFDSARASISTPSTIGIGWKKEGSNTHFYYYADNTLVHDSVISVSINDLSLFLCSNYSDNVLTCKINDETTGYAYPDTANLYNRTSVYRLYLHDGDAYGNTSTGLSKIADTWDSLTNQQKADAFWSTNGESSDITELTAISPFSILLFSEEELSSVSINALPKPQLVTPKGLIDIEAFERINKVTVTSTEKTAETVSLLMFDDASDPLKDEAGCTWHAVGSPVISTTESVFGGSSLYLDGTSGIWTDSHSGGNPYTLTGDFTIDWWENRSSTQIAPYPTSVVFGAGYRADTTGMAVNSFATSVGSNNFLASVSGTGWDISAPTPAPVANKWQHFAVVRFDNSLKLYIDGTAVYSGYNSQIKDGQRYGFGVYSYDDYGSTCNPIAYVDALRFVRGRALWTSNFTPPSDKSDYKVIPKTSAPISIIITTNNTNYYTWDKTALDWVNIDHTNLETVRDNGIKPSEISALTSSDWDKLIKRTGVYGIGFAYYLEQGDIDDTVEVDEISLNVDMKGSWEKATHGTDYTYGYPSNRSLAVTLMSNGDYKINYISSSSSGSAGSSSGGSSGSSSGGTTESKDIVYGFHINSRESDPASAVYYIGDAVGMTPAHMDFTRGMFDYGSWEKAFFMPRPCMLKYDGTVDYYLNPNDYSLKEDGTPSDIEDDTYEGNAMMEWGRDGRKIYYKVVPSPTDPTSADVYIANYEADGDYVHYSFIGGSNQEIDHFYTPIYSGSIVDGKLRSISAKTPETNNNASAETTMAEANGSGWYTEQWCDRTLINFLLILMGKSINATAVFGRGNTNGSRTPSGSLNTKGLFWGATNGTSEVKVFGMENYWGEVWTKVAGLINDNGEYKVKMTWGTYDGSSTVGYNTTGIGYLPCGAVPATSWAYISKSLISNKGILPSVMSGSSSTYYCGYFVSDNSQVNYAIVGGCNGDSEPMGPFSLAASYAPDVTNGYRGASISYKKA